MSLSKAEDSKFYTGRVIMGLDSNNNTQEMTIQEMEGKKSRPGTMTLTKNTLRESKSKLKVWLRI